MTVMVQMQLPRFLHSWMHDADDVKITEQFAQGCYGKSFKAKVTGVASVCCVKYLNDFVSQEAERDFWSSLVRVAEVGHINIVPFVGVAYCAGSSVITELSVGLLGWGGSGFHASFTVLQMGFIFCMKLVSFTVI